MSLTRFLCRRTHPSLTSVAFLSVGRLWHDIISLSPPQGTGRLPTSESSPATGYLSCVQKPEAVVHAMKVPFCIHLIVCWLLWSPSHKLESSFDVCFSTKLDFELCHVDLHFPRLRTRLRNGEHDYAAVLPSDTPKWNREIFNRSDQPSAGPTPDRDESLRFQVQTSETGPRFRGREPGFKKHVEAKSFVCTGKALKELQRNPFVIITTL